MSFDLAVYLILASNAVIILLVIALLVLRQTRPRLTQHGSPSGHGEERVTLAPLPTGHTWPDTPQEIVNTEGTFDRWICMDCGAHVQLRRGDTWQRM